MFEALNERLTGVFDRITGNHVPQPVQFRLLAQHRIAGCLDTGFSRFGKNRVCPAFPFGACPGMARYSVLLVAGHRQQRSTTLPVIVS